MDGLALLAGADGIVSVIEGAGEGTSRPRPLLVAQLVVGVVLLVWALVPKRWRGRDRLHAPEGGDGATSSSVRGATSTPMARPGRLIRWRDGAASGGARGGLLVLAAVAVLIEAATMLPYLGAVAVLASTGLTTGSQVLALAGYCLVMVTPALLLVAGRVLATRLVEPLLVRLDRWSRRASGEVLLWVAGIGGFLLARDAAAALTQL